MINTSCHFVVLWFKIIAYKIYKMITKESRRNRADTGAEITVPRAHVSCDHCLHEAHRRSCAECGCTNGDAGVHVGAGISPVFARDALRLAALDEDRRMREEAAREDPSRCPCGGRHFPSADACRWCLCHDPSRVNHLSQEAVDRLRYDMSIPPAPTHPVAEIMDSPPAKEIVVCGRCGHPDHGAGDGRCAFQVASRMQDEGFHTCPCDRDVAGSYRLEDAP